MVVQVEFEFFALLIRQKGHAKCNSRFFRDITEAGARAVGRGRGLLEEIETTPSERGDCADAHQADNPSATRNRHFYVPVIQEKSASAQPSRHQIKPLRRSKVLTASVHL